MQRRFLFVSMEGGGNVNPFLALGARLVARGHDVCVLGPPSLAARCAPVGLRHRPFADGSSWPMGKALADDVVVAAKAETPDALVVDFMLPDALTGAEASRTPTAALVHTLYHPIATQLLDNMYGPMQAQINEARAALDVPEVERLGRLLDRVDRVLVATLVELDPPGDTGLPPNACYVGALLEDAGPDAGWSPPVGDAPLVVVGLGTTAMDEGPVVQRVLDALAPLDVRVFATLGAHLDASAIDPPANALLWGYVHHAAVLPHAAAFVNHGGHSSIVAGLAHGTPMVCIPLGRDQPVNAERISATGAALALTTDATVEELRAAVVEVLEKPKYADAARALAPAAATDDRAVDELERLAVQGGRP